MLAAGLTALGLGLGALSIFAYLTVRLIQKSAVKAAEGTQLKEDLEDYSKATETYRESVKATSKEIPSTIDPRDPWAGL